jgi:hypothetical protein
MIEVSRYTPELQSTWDNFIRSSKNGVFAFERHYMDYHADRFEDHSLLFHSGGKLVSLLPCNLEDGVLRSHAGLTFGGMVTDYWMKTTLMLDIFEAWLAYCRRAGISKIVYKAIPYIYHVSPANEDLYALFRVGAHLFRRDAAFTVDQVSRPLYREQEMALAKDPNSRMRNRVRNLRKAREKGVIVEQSTDLSTFYAILSEMLMAIHGATSVHSLDELTLLYRQFPDKIKLYTARKDDVMLAGAIIYESNSNVAHAQYSANSMEGRKIRALDVIFDHLTTQVYQSWRYFDFGTSVEEEGRKLNDSLAEYKESFGARSTTYDHYELAV